MNNDMSFFNYSSRVALSTPLGLFHVCAGMSWKCIYGFRSQKKKKKKVCNGDKG